MSERNTSRRGGASGPSVMLLSSTLAARTADAGRPRRDDSPGNGDGPPYQCRIIDGPEHRGREVGPGQVPGMRERHVNCGPVPAGQRTIGEPGRPEHRPVALARRQQLPDLPAVVAGPVRRKMRA